MSIIELGALGEFLGSIGVIATLIYLAALFRGYTRLATYKRVPGLSSVLLYSW